MSGRFTGAGPEAGTGLIRIEVHGEPVWACNRDGQVLVAMRQLCRVLGLDWSGQRQRIMRDPVLSEGVVQLTIPSTCVGMTTTQGAEQGRQILLLPLELMHGWLFRIEATRVRPEHRDRVIAFQRTCYDVLDRHFRPRPAYPPSAALAWLGNRELRVVAAVRLLSSQSPDDRAPGIHQVADVAGVSFITARRCLCLLFAIGALDCAPRRGFRLIESGRPAGG